MPKFLIFFCYTQVRGCTQTATGLMALKKTSLDFSFLAPKRSFFLQIFLLEILRPITLSEQDYIPLKFKC